MQLYAPTAAEIAAAVSLLTTRLPADAARIARGALLLPALASETCAERNGYWQDAGLPFRVNADPGWTIPSSADERRNAADAEDSTPRSYNVTRSGCTCWAYLAAASAMTHTKEACSPSRPVAIDPPAIRSDSVINVRVAPKKRSAT